MIIRELRIESFGVLRDVAFHGLGPGVQVVYGQNEAGKTTLLEFIRGMVFGFEPRARYVCDGEQILSGRMAGEVRGNPFLISRRFSSAEGEACEIRWNEQRLSEDDFRELLHGFDESVFCSVFAITLDELARLRTLDEAQTADQFYDLSLGLDRAALGRLFAEIGNRRTSLLDPVAQSGEIPHLMAERRRLRQELENAAIATEEYGRLRLARDELLRAKAAEEAAAEELSRRLETLRTLDALAPQRERMRELQSLIAADAPSEIALKDCLAMVRRERKKLLEIRSRIRTLSERYRELTRALNESAPRPALLAIAPAVEGMRLNLPTIRQWLEEAESCRRAMAESAEKRRVIEAELFSEFHSGDASGQTKAAGANRDEPLSGTAHGGLNSAWMRRTDRAWREVRGLLVRYRKAKRRLQTLQGEQEKIAAGLRDRSGGIDPEEIAREIQRLGDRLAKLRRLEQICARVRETEKHCESARRELLKHLPEELTLQQNAVLGIVFVVGLSSALAAGLGAIGVPSFSGVGWIWGLLGGAAAATVPAVRSRLLARAGTVRAEAVRRLETAEGELRSLKSEQARLEAESNSLPERPDESAASMEKRLRELQELRVWLDEQRAAEQAVAEGERVRRAVSRRLRRSVRKWKELWRNAGFAGSPSPLRWPLWRRRLKDCLELDKRSGQHAQRLQSLDECLAAVSSRIEDLARDAAVALPDGSPEDKIRYLLGQVEKESDARSERRRIRRALASLRRELRKHRAIRAKRRFRLKRLYQRVGVVGYSQLKAKIESEERQASYRQELHRLQVLWQSTVEGIHDQELQKSASLSAAEVQQAVQKLETELDMRRSRLSELLQRLGRVSAQVESLAGDRSAQIRAMELASVESQTNRAARDWWTLSLSQKVLERVRRLYQNERQPLLLREASEYWQRMTDGRFRRVWTPLEQRVLLAEDRDGRNYSLDQLSRGTREQLFLCLRLALASHFGRRSEPIPLVLDDVLVNFDQVRAESACLTLMDFAGESRQILLFTCHDHVAGLFAAAGAAVFRLEDRRAEGASDIEIPPDRKYRITSPEPNVSQAQSRKKRSGKGRPATRAVDQTKQEKEEPSDSRTAEEQSRRSEAPRPNPAPEQVEAWFTVPEPYPIVEASDSKEPQSGRRSSHAPGRRNRAA